MPHSQSPSSRAHLEYEVEVAVHAEALERIGELERYARQCEALAASAGDALESEILLAAAQEYRRQLHELRGSFYLFSNVFTEAESVTCRRRLARRAKLYFIALALLLLGSILWRIW